MSKLLIGVPCYDKLNVEFVYSLMSSCVVLADNKITVDVKFKNGSLISQQRNSIAEEALKSGFDLLFIDSDMVFSPQDILNILKNDKDVCGGLCYTRREPHFGVVYESFLEEKEAFRRYSEKSIPKGLFKCEGIGTAFLFIKNAVLKKMFDKKNIKKYGNPFNMWQMKNGDQLGEDLSFCRRCLINNIDIWCDPNINIGHISEKVIYRPKSNDI